MVILLMWRIYKKNANFKFDVNLNLDKQIFFITLIIYIVIVAVIIILMIMLINLIRRRKGIYGFIPQESISYIDIPQTDDSFESYKDILCIETLDDLERFKIIESMDVIIRNAPNLRNSKIILTLHKGDILELIDSSIESDDIIWIKVKFNRRMIKR